MLTVKAVVSATACGLRSSQQFGRSIAIAALLLSAEIGLAATPTFTKDVAPILYKHCTSCHRQGEIGSALPLVSYDDARSQAESIKQSVVSRAMPPWPADPSHSMKFRNDPRLSQHEVDTLIAWVNAGAPKGKGEEPPVPNFPQGWLNPKGTPPDLVLPLREYHLPDSGEIPYVRQLVKVPFKEDKWIVALQVRPGNREVVHHMAITELQLAKGVTPDNLQEIADRARRLGLDAGSIANQPAVVDPSNPAAYDMLGVYTPGTSFESYEDGTAKLLKGGDNNYLNFNIHYQTTGKAETDQSMLGLWFRPDRPPHQVYRVPAAGQTLIANGKEILLDDPGQKAEGTSAAIPPIPPNAGNYEVTGITAYTGPVTIYQLQPHAHLRGKDFFYSVVYPDGREENVLSVPDYNFHWQLAYELEKPLALPPGSKLIVTAHYDNSLTNKHLQHHHHGSSEDSHFGTDKEVYFRENNQSWDEMFTPFIQYSDDSQDPANPAHSEPALKIAAAVGCLTQSASKEWTLTNASGAIQSAAQATSSTEVRAAAAKSLGNQEYQLLGANVFTPSNYLGQKVAVKGVLIEEKKASRLNVTSLQMITEACQ